MQICTHRAIGGGRLTADNGPLVILSFYSLAGLERFHYGPQQAMDYSLRHWDALARYTENGWLLIDNNAVEREMRSIAIGRKNWLFRGSDRGGGAAAVHFSLIATCRRHDLDPFVYPRSVLTELAKLGATATPEQLRALLPDRHRPS